MTNKVYLSTDELRCSIDALLAKMREHTAPGPAYDGYNSVRKVAVAKFIEQLKTRPRTSDSVIARYYAELKEVA